MSTDPASVGKAVDSIPVQFSYNIIELFSGQLYSSPIKAIEELVANSFDAFAGKCIISVPDGVTNRNVWVWDDGDSMDLAEMKGLWRIAESDKRIPAQEKKAEKRGRLPIGRFGIGKLASYVLGTRITHICRKEGKYLAVTMDYGRIKHVDKNQQIDLSVRELTKDELLTVIPEVAETLSKTYSVNLTGKDEDHWTLVVIDTLKKQLELGRLGWILSTALPLRPDFITHLNGKEIKSSKESIPKIKEWQIGNDDPVAKKLKYKMGEDEKRQAPYNYFVEIPNFSKISGEAEVYQDPIDSGRSANIGYSNGFFVMVRGRLINEYDNLFGITNLPHLGFNKLRVVVHADFIDDFLIANREDTSNGLAREAIQQYLRAAYYEARSWIEKEIQDEVKEASLEDHLRNIPGTLLQYPLSQALERIAKEKESGYSIKVVPGESPTPTIGAVDLEEKDMQAPLATLESGRLHINVNHPFYRDYADYPGVRKLMVAEVLLEAYMVDAGVNPNQTREILSRRDELLRTLASNFPEDVVAVAEAIKSAVTSQLGLEVASVDGFTVLGFVSAHLGGKGKPDGVASAPLGMLKGESRGYTVTIDAKSTQSAGVASGNLGLGTVARLRDEWSAQYAVVIAPNFQDTEGENSKCVKEARREKVSLIRAKDLADLVLASAAKPISLDKLKELFELRSPDETNGWIKQFKSESVKTPPIKLILETVWKIQQNDRTDAPEVMSIRYEEAKLKDFSKEQIKSWLESLQRLVPTLVVLTGDKVQLNQSPKNVVAQCMTVLQKLPSDIQVKPMVEALQAKK